MHELDDFMSEVEQNNDLPEQFDEVVEIAAQE